MLSEVCQCVGEACPREVVERSFRRLLQRDVESSLFLLGDLQQDFARLRPCFVRSCENCPMEFL